MFVWWLTGKIIRSVLCCFMYDSCAMCTTVVHNDMHTVSNFYS